MATLRQPKAEFEDQVSYAYAESFLTTSCDGTSDPAGTGKNTVGGVWRTNSPDLPDLRM